MREESWEGGGVTGIAVGLRHVFSVLVARTASMAIAWWTLSTTGMTPAPHDTGQRCPLSHLGGCTQDTRRMLREELTLRSRSELALLGTRWLTLSDEGTRSTSRLSQADSHSCPWRRVCPCSDPPADYFGRRLAFTADSKTPEPRL